MKEHEWIHLKKKWDGGGDYCSVPLTVYLGGFWSESDDDPPSLASSSNKYIYVYGQESPGWIYIFKFVTKTIAINKFQATYLVNLIAP